MDGRRIVVGVDRSPAAREALRWACRLARLWRGEIVVVHALGPRRPAAARGDVVDDRQVAIEQLVTAEPCGSVLLQAGALRVVVEEGQPVDLLVDVARAQVTDLVAVGRRDLDATPALALGSTSLRLLQAACWPVLVVPGPEEAARHRALRRILVAVDGVEPSADALELSGDLAAALDAWVTIVHAVEEVPVFPLGPATAVTSEGEIAAPARAHARLEALGQRLLAHGVPVDVRVERGPAREVVPRTAATIDADLVVLGSADTGHTGDPLAGSLSRQIVAATPRPALVVPDGWVRARQSDMPGMSRAVE
jgi:nucleotide-binding universal stress UspA family protein